MLPAMRAPDLALVSDEEIIARLQQGPPRPAPVIADLYQELFHRHYSKVIAWCWQFTGSEETARDLAQEAFLRAFRNLKQFRSDARFSTWLYVIARHCCLASAKRETCEPSARAEELSDHFADRRALETVRGIERDHFRRRLWQLMAETLDETELRVLRLHYAQEVPLNVVTRVLGLTNTSGAKAYIVRARRKLTAALSSAS